MKEYFEHPGISRSDLVNFNRSERYWQKMKASNDTSYTFQYGHAFERVLYDLLFYSKTFGEKYFVLENKGGSDQALDLICNCINQGQTLADKIVLTKSNNKQNWTFFS